ncbi:MAG: hypothetical protein KatS3mg105_4896 [Gemmatales bacterium]|nr:MAG: hypothetical protein KatS3mg105_4896 [Gemmatales bacterium]
MLWSFFAQAAQSPNRQLAFRQIVVAHLLVLTCCAWLAYGQGPRAPVLLGHTLLVAGIVEGAFLIGWRLTQLPKSRALEFVLVTQLRPSQLLVAESCVGLVRLALVTLSGLPILLLLTFERATTGITLVDVWPLLLMPFTWGALNGLLLTTWAYEPRGVRRWMERLALVFIILYLSIGVLGEKLFVVLKHLPDRTAFWLRFGFEAFHQYNPFGVMEFWMRQDAIVAEARMHGLEMAAVAAVGLMMLRTACRIKGHFDELHYAPVEDRSGGRFGPPGEHPLSWWAVRRVSEYSGRINLWLASAFGILYAAYLVSGPSWPMGRTVFVILETKAGGVPGLTTALVVLAAVPAAFQYGLWDSNAQERCRRLELLLLTELTARDYWRAAAAAAWFRGRGYFFVALVLWTAGVIAGKTTLPATLASLFAAVVLWFCYFSFGFRSFARGHHANHVGMLLTIGLPLLAYGLFQANVPFLGSLLLPGSVYGPIGGLPWPYWIGGPLLGLVVAWLVTTHALKHCERELREWYEDNHGRKVID